MLEFALALVVFIASHVVPAATGIKQAAIARIGRRAYLTLYSLLSLALLCWVISAALRAPYVALWPPSRLTHLAPLLAMGPALFLLISGLRRPNPLSISLDQGALDPADPGAVALTRHPVLWGFGLWSGAHAVANGDLVSLILFGGLTAFALRGARTLDKRARARLGVEGWVAARAVSAGSRKARLARLSTPRTAAEAAAALLIYAALLWAHPALFGADPLALWR